MKNIYLIGMMGSGKTSTAHELARLLSMPVIDLDAELEKKTGMKISEVFRTKGEKWFRESETHVLVSYPVDAGAIFATGGGVILARQNREWMSACGVIIYLETSPEWLWTRVSKESGRPLLEEGNPKQKLLAILSARQPLYEECAHIRVVTDGKTPLEVAKELQSKIHANHSS